MFFTLKTMVLMTTIAWAPGIDGALEKQWSLNKVVSLEHCVKMSDINYVGGSKAVITVTCSFITPETKDKER